MKNGDYILVKAPAGYLGKLYRLLYCYEHHSVWWLATGEVLMTGEVIHHKDGNKHNNDLSNLEKLTGAVHRNLHARAAKPAVSCVCPKCNEKFELPRRVFDSRQKSNGASWTPCCSRGCSISYNNTGQRQGLSEKLAQIKHLRVNGLSSYSIASTLGVSRNTVMKYW